MATLRRWHTSLIVRTLLCFVAASLAWLQVGPAYGLSVSAGREAARRESWRLARLPHLTAFATPAQKEVIRRKSLPRPVADVRPLSASEMARARGRGLYRRPEYCGTLPWQRSLRDVNLCNGNLFKSFTDVQVAPARGAGLVLQRTYNSNDGRIGPFGVGWDHAYDIRIQESADVRAEESQATTSADLDQVPRTDFFGAKHSYHRDADGLYSPPPYLFDDMSSSYDKFLVTGPTKVLDDTEKGMDGTVKHYFKNGNERDCDYIQDRHGNKTTLTYSTAITLPDGHHPLSSVTDPSGRVLTFVWANLGMSGQPAWRITEVDAPTDPTTGSPVYRVTYAYYIDAASANAANELYNLKSVTLDPDGLSRTTTYTYTSVKGDAATETGLLVSISDPLGHSVSYAYDYVQTYAGDLYTPSVPAHTLVSQVIEPGGQDALGNSRVHTWTMNIGSGQYTYSSQGPNLFFYRATDTRGRMVQMEPEDDLVSGVIYASDYDASNNLLLHGKKDGARTDGGIDVDSFTYGPHGNVLTHRKVNSGIGGECHIDSVYTCFPGTETTTYYNIDKYFQKQSVSDMNGHITAMDYFNNQDASLGNRGEVQWVRDAGYSDPSSPSYGKQFMYTYNQYGQKTSETNLRGVVTQYTYGDAWGNLTQVVQDPGAGHLNRTTTMTYDVMGRVLRSTDPAGQTSTFAYNSLGQPQTVSTPAKGVAPAETISYVYDGNGRTHSVQDNRGITTMAYEAGCDRVRSVTDPITGTASYTYDLLGDRLSMTLPGGGTWTYKYLTLSPQNSSNPNGYDNHVSMPDDNPDHITPILSSIQDDQGRVVNYTINAAGQLYGSFSPISSRTSLATQYLHDLAVKNSNTYTHGWLSEVKTVWNGSGPSSGISRVLSQNDYTYDTMGQRLTNTVTTQPARPDGSGQTDANGNPALTSRTESYAYDSLNHLSAVDYGDGEKQGDPTSPAANPGYTFDPMGNRLTKSDSLTSGGTTTTNTTASTFDAANRLLSVAQNGGGASAVTSDPDGNTLTDASGRSMTWDSQNRMTSCTKAGVTSTYTYGADGLRRSSTVDGVTTYYAYDGQTMIREMKRNPNTGALFNTATYLQGVRGGECRIDETQVSESYTDPATGNTGIRGKTSWYVYDGLGSVVGEVAPDAMGTMTSSPKYDVYGAVRGNPGTASTRQGFVGGLGHVSDSETGLIYMRARYYDPTQGRFESEDPAMDGGSWFVYCDDNPINKIDDTGKAGKWVTVPGTDWEFRLESDNDPGTEHIHLRDGKGRDMGGYWKEPRTEVWKHGDGGGVSNKVRKGMARAGHPIPAMDSISASFDQDPLFVISLMLSASGDDEDAVKVDNFEASL